MPGEDRAQAAHHLRISAVGVSAFTILYVLHRILQATGPGGSDAALVMAYEIAHRGRLLISEIAVCLALLAFVAFVAGLVPVFWRAGEEVLAVAVGISGAIFVALGFVSSAAETALIWIAASHDPTAVAVLDQLQGRIPVVWSIAALVGVTSLAVARAGLARRWLAIVGLAASVIFVLGSFFSVVGSTPEAGASMIGIGLFIAWSIVLAIALWHATMQRAPTKVR
jgi:hypothetical protein